MAIQFTEVAKIRKAWIEAGNVPCDHPAVDKEYYKGTQTGDDACTVCGDTWWHESMRTA